MSSEQDILLSLRAIMSEVLALAPERITMDSSMDNLKEWDSLHFLMLVQKVEERFDMSFKSEDLLSLRSVRALIAVIRKSKDGSNEN